MPSVHLLRDERRHVWQGGQQCDFEIAQSRQALQNRRQPKGYAVAPTHCAEVAERKKDYVTVAESLPDTVGTKALFAFFFALQFGGNPGSLVPGMPAIHLRALHRSTMSAAWISSRKFPRKKIPAPRPITRSLNPRSWGICSAAAPTFIRSKKAIT